MGGMQTEIFQGKVEALKIEESLKELGSVKGKKLLIIQADGASEESVYVKLKREMGERLGVKIEVIRTGDKKKVLELIEKANGDSEIEGILVQLPILGADRVEVEQILSSISLEKDVDGLNPKSSFVPSVVMAVETVLEKINLGREKSIGLVGSAGMVGRRLYDRLLEIGYVVSGFEDGDDLMTLSEFDVVISTTGVAEVIKAEMVKEGFIGIDLGFPRAEISLEASKKARFITPIPGGVGPLTVVCLFENLGEI